MTALYYGEVLLKDLNTFDAQLQFTMEIGGRSLHFLDLLITIVDNKLVTSVYSKPTDAHLYLNAKSSHPKSQILGIARGVALRLRRICSDDEDFKQRSIEYNKYLIDVGMIVSTFLKYLTKSGA